MTHTYDSREDFAGLAQSIGIGLARFGAIYSHGSHAAIRVSSTPTASPAAIAEELGAVGPSQVVEPHVVVAVDTFAEVS